MWSMKEKEENYTSLKVKTSAQDIAMRTWWGLRDTCLLDEGLESRVHTSTYTGQRKQANHQQKKKKKIKYHCMSMALAKTQNTDSKCWRECETSGICIFPWPKASLEDRRFLNKRENIPILGETAITLLIFSQISGKKNLSTQETTP